MSQYANDKNELVEFILSHFRGQEYEFPRTIMTNKIKVQRPVNSRKEMLEYFEEANFTDCKINGYPFRHENESTKSYPSFIFIDLDLSVFDKYRRPKNKLDITLKQTLTKIKEEINGQPTVLSTGGGYHIYQPIKLVNQTQEKRGLETYEIFDEFLPYISNNLTTEFIRFAEKYFTDGKCDPKHTPSTNSCLIRIPESLNSKHNYEVTIIQKWDGIEADAKSLLSYFWDHLIQLKIEYDETKRDNPKRVLSINSGRIKWIERLLQTPIQDHRNFSLWRILIPYLKNIKKMQRNEVISVLTLWLDECNKLNKVIWRYPQRIERQMRSDKGYPPISFENLKKENFELYKLLEKGHI